MPSIKMQNITVFFFANSGNIHCFLSAMRIA
uniref:Uncharacterized protein n=1 Tax=Siphoviridae sp. ctrfD19 TaxID=2826478 RepID=A0A8S5M1R9_9CAUD|nr:MAG TPA: hypothetical protein [Siphoviridae sp. ctrfD19]